MPRIDREEAKLVEYFRDHGDVFGRQGDHDNLSPAETAIRALRVLALLAEKNEIIRQSLAKYGVL